jgi:hypothetical protein
MSYCRSLLSQPLVEKIKKRGMQLELDSNKATVVISFIVHFEKQSYMSQYTTTLPAKMKIEFIKITDGNWLINRAEILEIARKPMSWNQM